MKVIINVLRIDKVAIRINLKKLLVAFVVISTITYGVGTCQKRIYPEIGKPVPDFNLNNIEGRLGNLPLTKSDFRGKNVILDFWSVGCVPCVKSFPIINEFQKKFANKVDFILIGDQERKRDERAFYKKFEKMYSLDLAVAYDSALLENFVPMKRVPHVIWIDTEGIVKAITSSKDITIENLDRFVNGLNFEFSDISYSGRENYGKEVDLSKPLLVDGNGGADTSYLFRSLIAKWRPGMGKPSGMDLSVFMKHYKENLYQATKVQLIELYMLAYFGSLNFIKEGYYPYSIINSKDSLLFKRSYMGIDKVFYNYSLEVPIEGSSKEKLMRFMQNDLKNYFNYDVNVSQKEMPCLKLIVKDINKLQKNLKTKQNPENRNAVKKSKWDVESKINFVYDWPLSDLPKLLASHLALAHLAYNDTGLDGKITLEITGDIQDMQNIRSQLMKVGLDLKPDSKLFPVLEIKDSN